MYISKPPNHHLPLVNSYSFIRNQPMMHLVQGAMKYIASGGQISGPLFNVDTSISLLVQLQILTIHFLWCHSNF